MKNQSQGQGKKKNERKQGGVEYCVAKPSKQKSSKNEPADKSLKKKYENKKKATFEPY